MRLKIKVMRAACERWTPPPQRALRLISTPPAPPPVESLTARQQEAKVEVCWGAGSAGWIDQLIEMMEEHFSFLLLWIESNPPHLLPHPMVKFRLKTSIDYPRSGLLGYLILQTLRQNSKEKAWWLYDSPSVLNL